MIHRILTKRLPDNQYYPELKPKDFIVLHFTAGGSVDGAFQTWKSNAEHVATAFIVDRDGSVYEVFNPNCWAYHLGGTTSKLTNQRSIGIEIVNWGPLRKGADGLFYAWPSNYSKIVVHPDQVFKLEHPWRQEQYYQAFPDVQVEAVAKLSHELCVDFTIPASIPPLSTIMLTLGAVNDPKLKGIYAHQQDRYRASVALEAVLRFDRGALMYPPNKENVSEALGLMEAWRNLGPLRTYEVSYDPDAEKYLVFVSVPGYGVLKASLYDDDGTSPLHAVRDALSGLLSQLHPPYKLDESLRPITIFRG